MDGVDGVDGGLGQPALPTNTVTDGWAGDSPRYTDKAGREQPRQNRGKPRGYSGLG